MPRSLRVQARKGRSSTGDMSLTRHAARQSGTLRVTPSRQTPIWQHPAPKTAGTPQADTHRHVNGTAILGLVCQFSVGASTLGTGKLARRPLPFVTFRGAPDTHLFNPSVSAPANRSLPCGPSSNRLRGQAAAVVLLLLPSPSGYPHCQ